MIDSLDAIVRLQNYCSSSPWHTPSRIKPIANLVNPEHVECGHLSVINLKPFHTFVWKLVLISFQWYISVASVGVGVEHEVLVDLAKKSFAKKPFWKDSTDLKMNVKNRDLSVSQYTGGKVTVIHFFIAMLMLNLSTILNWLSSTSYFSFAVFIQRHRLACGKDGFLLLWERANLHLSGAETTVPINTKF